MKQGTLHSEELIWIMSDLSQQTVAQFVRERDLIAMSRHHVAYVVAPSNEVRRDDWPVTTETELDAQRYAERLPVDCGDVSIPFDGLELESLVQGFTRRSAAIFTVEVEGIVGVGGLLLSGKDDRADEMSAIRYMHKLSSPEWCLPLPPLEIVNRPLLYYTVFRTGEVLEGNDWYNMADSVLRKAHALGIALLRCANCRVR